MLWLTKLNLISRSVLTRRRAVDALCRKPVKGTRTVDVMLGLLGESDAEVRCVAMTAAEVLADSHASGVPAD